jgi:DNA-binding NarL/FixJ family response regulator
MNALKEIAKNRPQVRCIIYTASDDAAVAMSAIQSGARGYVLKDAGLENLFAAVRIVMTDQSYVSPEFATRLVAAAAAQAQAKNQGDQQNGLNVRESQVLQEARRGLTNRQIGEQLRLSERTVKHYMSSAMQKFGVSNRVAALNMHRGTSGNNS